MISECRSFWASRNEFPPSCTPCLFFLCFPNWHLLSARHRARSWKYHAAQIWKVLALLGLQSSRQDRHIARNASVRGDETRRGVCQKIVRWGSDLVVLLGSWGPLGPKLSLPSESPTWLFHWRTLIVCTGQFPRDGEKLFLSVTRYFLRILTHSLYIELLQEAVMALLPSGQVMATGRGKASVCVSHFPRLP